MAIAPGSFGDFSFFFRGLLTADYCHYNGLAVPRGHLLRR